MLMTLMSIYRTSKSTTRMSTNGNPNPLMSVYGNSSTSKLSKLGTLMSQIRPVSESHMKTMRMTGCQTSPNRTICGQLRSMPIWIRPRLKLTKTSTPLTSRIRSPAEAQALPSHLLTNPLTASLIAYTVTTPPLSTTK